MTVLGIGGRIAAVALAAPFIGARAVAQSPAATSTMSLAASTVTGGNSVAGKVILSAPAPAGGVIVTLLSPSIAIAGFVSPTLGASSQVARLQVTVQQGAVTAPFTVLSSVVATPSSVTLQASSSAGTATANLTVNPATVKSVTVVPTGVTGGKPVALTVTLDGRAPPSTGAQVALSSSLPATLSVPPTLAIPPNATSATISVTTASVATRAFVSITAQSTGGAFTGAPATTSLVVVPPAVTAIQVSPTAIFGGTSSTGTVILDAPAPAGGRVVNLASSSLDVRPPASVTVPQGLDRQSFPVATNAVTDLRTGTITSPPLTGGVTPSIADGSSNTISAGEATSRASATLTVVPVPQLQSVAAAPAQITGGDSVSINVSWTQPSFTVPTTLSGSSPLPIAVVQLTTDHAELVSMPSTVALNKLPAVGVRAASTPSSSDQSVVITATFNKQSVSTTLLIKKPIPPIATFTLRPTSVSGGNVIAQFTLSPLITSAVTVRLTTDHPEIVQLPSSVSVSPSSVATPFTFTTVKPSTTTVVTITATAGTQVVTTTLTARP